MSGPSCQSLSFFPSLLQTHSRSSFSFCHLLRYRQTNAPHLFLGAYLAQAPTKVAGPLTVSAFSSAPRKLIGFICATASPALTLRSMSVHSAEEGTPLVCIHSVVVSKEWRHRGIASTLLKEFHRRIKNAEESGRGGGGDRPKSSSGTGTPGSSNSSSQNLSSMNSNSGNPITSLLSNRNKEKSKTDIARGYEAFALLAHEELTGLYLKNGFRILGHSHIQYGSGGWLEMRKDIIEKDKDEEKLRLESLEESRRKDREDDKLRMEESKKEREKEREEKRKASSLLLETKNKGSGNESDGNVSDHQILKGDNEMMTSPIALNSGLPSSTSSPNKNSNPNNSGFPAGINQESILAALRSTSLSNRKNSGAANPSQPYTQVLGATLAAKTPAEDSFAALEARLVNQKLGTNLAELYCPMEDCGSILLKKGSSNWTLCEAGPLLDPKLSLPEKKYPKPPSGPLSNPVPAASSIDKAPRANISTQDLSGAGPLRGFWSVNSPMSFENVGFSKDQEWIPPWVKDATSVENGGAGDLPNNQESISNPSSGNEKEKDLDGKPKREKPTRKGTWRERVRERSFTGNFLSSSESESSPSSKEKEPTIEDEKVYNEPPTLSLPKSDRDPLIVKFITCGECDCGPLGFTFLHKSQANGGLADQVSREIDGVNNAGGNRDRAVGQQELLVAADRVRYRFLKN